MAPISHDSTIIGLIARDGVEPTAWLEQELRRIVEGNLPAVGLTAIRGDVDVVFAELLHSVHEPCIVIRDAGRPSTVTHEVELRLANRAPTLVTLLEISFERYVIDQSNLVVVVTSDRLVGDANLETMLARAVLRGAAVLVLDVATERTDTR